MPGSSELDRLERLGQTRPANSIYQVKTTQSSKKFMKFGLHAVRLEVQKARNSPICRAGFWPGGILELQALSDFSSIISRFRKPDDAPREAKKLVGVALQMIRLEGKVHHIWSVVGRIGYARITLFSGFQRQRFTF
jgi:hypothetical protein